MRAPWCQGGANRCAGRCRGAGQGSTGGASGAPPRSWLLPPIQRQGVTLPLNGGIVPRSVLTLGAQVGSEEPPPRSHHTIHGSQGQIAPRFALAHIFVFLRPSLVSGQTLSLQQIMLPLDVVLDYVLRKKVTWLKIYWSNRGPDPEVYQHYW